ncbi:hypothetical protein J5224_28560, partial [Candidatus Symbiopectobacterium sp. NZEC135]|nr:hypothetical protein [Candidatus Symbiopectobacterium sp. NZEC135]
TSKGAQEKATSFLNALKEHGIIDPLTGGWFLPPSPIPPTPNDSATGPSTSCAENTVSPIIIDLDRDGVETLSVSAGILFDHFGNNLSINTGWVAPDDGLLVLDRNDNGNIDDGRELFGNNTPLKNNEMASNGYNALKVFDDNSDNAIDAKDSIFESLKIWRDSNANAKVDLGELYSLKDFGVASISIEYDNSTFVDPQGNAHQQRSLITYVDGVTGQSADVWFAANLVRTRYDGTINLKDSIRKLPYVRGFGNMVDLHVSMSENDKLNLLVKQFCADPVTARDTNLINEIMYAWAGVDELDSNSRGGNIDARQLSVLEIATGRNYKNHTNGTTNPLPGAAIILESEYSRFSANIEAHLLAQTLFRSEFNLIKVVFNTGLSKIDCDFSALSDHLSMLKDSDVESYL